MLYASRAANDQENQTHLTLPLLLLRAGAAARRPCSLSGRNSTALPCWVLLGLSSMPH
jgi:hypothetical protein